METHTDASGEAAVNQRPTSTSHAPLHPIVDRLHITRRTLQIGLGLLWILDGALKFQPHLFKPSFVADVVRPMAVGQPGLVGSVITHMANFLSQEATMWVAIFGLIEIAIGVALLFRRTAKPALVASFVWGIGIYIFGEGLGMVLTGDTSPLQGAPGAVCFYILLGVMVWPKAEGDADRRRTGFASSAAGRGVFGGTGSLLVWASIWFFEAILWLLPFNRTGNAISDQMAGTADGEPGWYAHFLTSFGHAFAGAGVWMAVILATASLVIAFGPLISKHPQVYIGLGIALALGYWVTGQGLGELLTGGGTDPNNGPLIALIGLALLPAIPADGRESTPALRLISLHPLGTLISAAAVALVPLAVAVVPSSADAVASGSNPVAQVTSATPAPTSRSMSGASMKGMTMSPTPEKTPPTSTVKGMNMAGMAGLGVTKSDWRYTGPPLPPAEVASLISVGDMTDAGHKMQTPHCTAAPTSQQILGATQYIQATSAAVAKYKNLSAATAAGYVPITNPNYPVVHYLNTAYLNGNDVMNPDAVDSLVYATTPYGPVLVAAMYLMPGQGNGPMPYGCLVQWHAHTNLCRSDSTGLIDGFTPCRSGTTHAEGTTPMMTHVWQVPVAGGPLAIDPSDLQVVEAAIMAQQEGLAPTTTGSLPAANATTVSNGS
jgi:hypothetical protein